MKPEISDEITICKCDCFQKLSRSSNGGGSALGGGSCGSGGGHTGLFDRPGRHSWR